MKKRQRLARYLERRGWGRRVLAWWLWHVRGGPGRDYWREECEKLRAGRDRDALRIRDLSAENEELKRRWRKVRGGKP